MNKMLDEDPPDPDRLLRVVQMENQKENLGKLKIFFGMSAGVGKTYSMLQEAQRRMKEGASLVVGTINTHGRKETIELLEGVPRIAEKWVIYKEAVFEEFDLEKVLEIKPELVLVDELAHTNVPGSKHPKRWQDVMELLDAGIDVYTTLNVQHIESRKELIESLTGIQIHETVPDLILERAATIEIIDIPPPELLQRLREGKVYFAGQSQLALEHFFKEENLTALREIALRFTAEKVDHDLHGMLLTSRGWRTRERLLAVIDTSLSSQPLIRSARRLAFELDAPWIILYIDTGKKLTDAEQKRVSDYLNLAQELGAEIVTTRDMDIAESINRIAKNKDVTRIILNRPLKKKFWHFFQEDLIDRLRDKNTHIDLIILREEGEIEKREEPSFLSRRFSISWSAYFGACGVVVFLTLLGLFLNPLIGYKSVGFIFLIGILFLGFFLGEGPALFAAILSSLSWNFLFIPPLFTFRLSEPEDIALVLIYFSVAVVVGILTSRLRNQEQFLYKREEEIEHLYEIEREIANATTLQSLRVHISTRLSTIFPGHFDILVKNSSSQIVLDSQLPAMANEKEKAAILWVAQSGKLGGWSTDTLPSSLGIYFPIKCGKKVLGVLVYYPKRQRTLSVDEMNFIQTILQQLGLYLERYTFKERMTRQDYTLQTERMHHAIFHSLNRSFYSPLEEVIAVTDQLKKNEPSHDKIILFNQIEDFITNIKLTVDNVIAISELESGFVHFERKNHAIKELIEKTVIPLQPFLHDRSIQTHLLNEELIVPFDFNLMKLAVGNLILNALLYSPSPKPVAIEAELLDREFKIAVVDEGPGIPEDLLPLIFEKFYRIPGTPSKRLGLGLAIVRSVVDIHQGKIEVKNREIGGTVFSMILPIP